MQIHRHRLSLFFLILHEEEIAHASMHADHDIAPCACAAVHLPCATKHKTKPGRKRSRCRFNPCLLCCRSHFHSAVGQSAYKPEKELRGHSRSERSGLLISNVYQANPSVLTVHTSYEYIFN